MSNQPKVSQNMEQNFFGGGGDRDMIKLMREDIGGGKKGCFIE